MVVCTNCTSPAWGHLWPHSALKSLSPEKKIPQEEPFEANTFPVKPWTLKAQLVPGEDHAHDV